MKMMPNWGSFGCRAAVAGIAAMGLVASAAHADVVSTDNVTQIAPPLELLTADEWLTPGDPTDCTDSQPIIHVFNEGRALVPEFPDEIQRNGMRMDPANNPNVIPHAGTDLSEDDIFVNSHLIFFDPMPGPFAFYDFEAEAYGPMPCYQDGVSMSGSVTFDGEIIGVASDRFNLERTSFLGADGTLYDDNASGAAFRAIEGANIRSDDDSYEVRQSVQFDTVMDTIDVNLSEGIGGQYQGDWIRVLTLDPGILRDAICNENSGDGDPRKCGYVRPGPSCGNEVVETGTFITDETCDDGRHCVDGSSCTSDADCAGIDPEDEVCRTRDGDGCSRQCQIEGEADVSGADGGGSGGEGEGDPEEDDGCGGGGAQAALVLPLLIVGLRYRFRS